MSMSAKSFPEKDNIIQWCKDDGLSCDDISAKNPTFAWCLELGSPKVIIYKLSTLPDRIYFQTNTGLAPEHVKLLDEDASKKGNLILKIQNGNKRRHRKRFENRPRSRDRLGSSHA